MEAQVLTLIEMLIAAPEFGGRYVSLTPGHANAIDDAEHAALVASGYMFKNMAEDEDVLSAGVAAHWPHGRGCGCHNLALVAAGVARDWPHGRGCGCTAAAATSRRTRACSCGSGRKTTCA